MRRGGLSTEERRGRRGKNEVRRRGGVEEKRGNSMNSDDHR